MVEIGAVSGDADLKVKGDPVNRTAMRDMIVRQRENMAYEPQTIFLTKASYWFLVAELARENKVLKDEEHILGMRIEWLPEDYIKWPTPYCLLK